ncbi:eukaryotic translation initiation factor 4E transporter isoform X5 [Parus major]|uniref:eukaryotic translation initiation factor 4E transporter isoform X4 n=1 Tax=Pseudopodoces humilis TaxID=181119 RepID=UPI0006B875C7|nr:PREDICTED: eukaryotic translation initiation factor 4E transporter isoform X4 [Pseudopodoces humilis]XP_015499833.1 eukaryotic translation initiation factor 4E transporter isoform X5 [Parus major]XP_023793408.1 eukaryotic translation initiation factor 4E transporter isoform X7 [Cyanistes caeruleus]XP_058707582.1 eukaryotic translation initiation factor 4E transporter isoform X5 [Poecile atricapillus]
MDKRGGATETENGDAFLELNRITTKYPHRYTKEELLDIKERPYSKKRPSCLSEKYDSDGVWDPEKWHASLYPTSGRTSPVESFKKDLDSDRTSLMRRIVDPRERVKEDDLDVVLSPQRRSFGGGCHVTASVSSRRAGSPLEKDSDGVRVIGGRRIGSGRIISSRNFDKDHRGGDSRDARDRDRDRDYKDKRFRREFGDSKRVFGERRRNDSYTEEEPEWFSAGPTSQSETIELTGFDDKILEEDHKGRKRTRRRTASLKEGIECNGGVAEEDEVQTVLANETPADQEVPREAVLQEPAPGEFDFNEFFNLDKSVPGLASMIEDVLGEGAVSASRFSRWFSNPSRSGSRSSSLRSTPHEELERLAGLEQAILSPGQNSGNYFAPIPLEDHSENKVDILEMLQKAKVDLKPLLSSLSANKEKLRESTHSGVVLSVEEVEAGLKGLKVDQEGKIATPFMAEQMEEALNVSGSRQMKKDGDMTAFNKLVSSMKASGTLPSQPKVNQSLESHLMSPPEMSGQPLSKNILQELLGPPITRPASSNVLSGLIGGLEPAASLLTQRAPSPPIPPVFPTRAASADYLRHRISSPIGFGQGSQQLLGDPFPGVRKPMSPVAAQMSPLEIQQAALEGLALPHDLAIHAANFYQHGFGKPQMDKSRDGYRNRQQRVTKSPAPGHRGNASSPAPAASITSMLSPSFTPTSVIRKMYESKEKSKDDPVSGKMKISDVKDENQRPNEGLVQRMMAQGVHPQHLPLLQAGMLPPGVDLSHLQGISAPILGQPFYPLPTASHHILNPRSGTPLQLAMMQQQLQRSGSGAQGSPAGAQTAPQNVLPRTGLSHGHTQLDHRPSQRSGSPIGLAKWFGSDVLQQPLPSMPSKVISVDELEYRQ